jgi:hypothetical protein
MNWPEHVGGDAIRADVGVFLWTACLGCNEVQMAEEVIAALKSGQQSQSSAPQRYEKKVLGDGCAIPKPQVKNT